MKPCVHLYYAIGCLASLPTSTGYTAEMDAKTRQERHDMQARSLHHIDHSLPFEVPYAYQTTIHGEYSQQTAQSFCDSTRLRRFSTVARSLTDKESIARRPPNHTGSNRKNEIDAIRYDWHLKPYDLDCSRLRNLASTLPSRCPL